MTPSRRLGLKRKPTQRQLDDRAVRQSEDYYKKLGYQPETIEAEAEMDFQIGQRLKGRKRGLRNVKLTGTPN